MSLRKGWLPREGFTLDVVQRLVLNTALNPVLTVPLLLLARHTVKGQGFALDHPTAVRRLKLFLYLGVARWLNGFLNQGSQNNWTGDKFDWDKEIVLITGGSDGFGKLLVHLFAKRNPRTKIINLDIQSPKYDAPSPNVHFLECDLSSPAAIESVARDVKTTHGDPSVLIMNAGIAIPSTIVGMKDSNLEKLFAVNTFQHYRLAREFLPQIAAKNHGIVAVTASLAGYVTPAGMTDYCASKSAAISFYEGMTAELRDRLNAPKVRTICVCPNFARTKLADGFVNESNFVSPWLYPETVTEAIFEKILSGNSGFVVIPKSASFIAQTVRSWPWWMQKHISASLGEVMRAVDGSQK